MIATHSLGGCFDARRNIIIKIVTVLVSAPPACIVDISITLLATGRARAGAIGRLGAHLRAMLRFAGRKVLVLHRIRTQIFTVSAPGVT